MIETGQLWRDKRNPEKANENDDEDDDDEEEEVEVELNLVWFSLAQFSGKMLLTKFK